MMSQAGSESLATPKDNAAAFPPYPGFTDRGPFRFTSGIAAQNPASMRNITHGLIDSTEAPYRRQVETVYACLEEFTSDIGGLPNVLRQHLYQRSKRQFPVIEDVRLRLEGDTPAPSSGVGIGLLRGDPSVTYEVDSIALSPYGRTLYGDRAVLAAAEAGPPASHYTQAVQAGPYLFLAGMIPIDSRTSEVISGFEDVEPEGRWLQRHRSHPDSRVGPIAAQTWSLYQRILSFLASRGLTSDAICQTTLFIENAGDLADSLRVHEKVFPSIRPALQVVEVDEVGHRGTLIEIECTASTQQVTRVNGAQSQFTEVPDVCVTEGLAFVSDHLGLDNQGSLCRGLDDVAHTGADQDDVAKMRALVSGRESSEVLVAQAYMAFDGLVRSLHAANLQCTDVGHLLVRASRPNHLEAIEHVRRLVMGSDAPAATILSTHSIPQSEHALIAVAAHAAVEHDEV